MEENVKVVEAEVKEEKTETGETQVVAEVKPNWKDRLHKSWIWKNRGKVGTAFGAAAAFVVMTVLGRGDDNGNDIVGD